MTREEELSGAQAVLDVSSAILKTTGEVMKLHGPDPTSIAILAGGFCMAINSITESIDPTFKDRLLRQLR